MAERTEVRCYIGLGSNLGDRERSIRRATELLAATPSIAGVHCSALYETAPVGFLDQPAFLNAVAGLRTRLGPTQLLLALKRIEERVGRLKRRRWGPREIDLDLLLYAEEAIDRRGLTVPHRELFHRAFVLAPLAELRPDLRDPSGRPIGQVLAELATEQRVVRWGG